jgi:SAM-dependent methyltransferase
MPMTADDLKATIRASWAGAAGGWDRWFEWYGRNFRPAMDWACDAVGARPGARILDLASGSGEPALPLARRVQPDGRVVATDLTPDMLAVARRRAAEAGLTNLEFHEMDAEHLRFPGQTFDAVTCAYGLMFCPDPVRAVSEVRRVLKPGGRFAFVVWDHPAKSPFLTTAGGSVARFFPAAPPSPDAPGPFRFGEPGVLDGVLRAAGLTDFSVRSLPMTLECASVAEYWRMFTDVAAGIRAKIGTLNASDAARLVEIVEEAAKPYVEGGRLRLVATSLCASGVV